MDRTQEEILERIEKIEPSDMLGFEWHEYIVFLDAEHAKPYLKPNAEWEPQPYDPIERLKDYMEYAFDKAHGQRGISANRSVQHMTAWLWLAGEDELHQWVEHEYGTNYHSYGLPILNKIADHFGIKKG